MRARRLLAGLILVAAVVAGTLASSAAAFAAPRPQLIPMPMFGTVAGRVTDVRNGQPVKNVNMTLRYLDGSSWVATGWATTGVDGRYSMWVPTGSAYRISAWDPTGFYAVRGWPTARNEVSGTTVTVSWFATTTCDIAMPVAGYSRLRLVTEATGGPIATGLSNARDVVAGTAWGVAKDSQGWCTLRGMNPGTWELFGLTSDAHFYTPAYPYGTDGRGTYTVSAQATTTVYVPFRHVPSFYKDVVRKSGADRYETALRLANEAFPRWQGVTDVIVASGEDASAVDALSAAGLAGAYDAPLLLVRKDSVPPGVTTALKAIPGYVDVHIVGGTASVSDNVKNAIDALSNVTTVDRCYGADRYATAAQVASWMKTKLGSLPPTALIANGADPAHYYDALALSPVAYAEHFPILLVKQGSVPGATSLAIFQLGLGTRYIAGSDASVSDDVAATLVVPPAQRLAGATREQTAIAIAEWANTNHYLGYQSFGLAANIPDALAAGATMGKKGGVMLLTRPALTSVPPVVTQNLNAHVASVQLGVFCGGTNVIPESARLGLQDTLNH